MRWSAGDRSQLLRRFGAQWPDLIRPVLAAIVRLEPSGPCVGTVSCQAGANSPSHHRPDRSSRYVAENFMR